MGLDWYEWGHKMQDFMPYFKSPDQNYCHVEAPQNDHKLYRASIRMGHLLSVTFTFDLMVANISSS